MLFRCVVKLGHVGTGNYLEQAIVLDAVDVVEAWLKAQTLPGVKKGRLKHTGASVLGVSQLQSLPAD